MTYLKTLLLVGSALAFTACGGGSSSSSTPAPIVDPMTERDLILIMHHMEPGVCEDPEFQNYLKDSMIDQGFIIDYYLFREESLDVSCATYGRTNDVNDDGGCMTQDLALLDPSMAEYKASCVIGMDADMSDQPAFTQMGSNKEITSAIGTSITTW